VTGSSSSALVAGLHVSLRTHDPRFARTSSIRSNLRAIVEKSSVSVVAAWVLLPVNLLARSQPRLALEAFSDNAISRLPSCAVK
jgi:hypothetical protein